MAGELTTDDEFRRSDRLGAMILAQHPPEERKTLQASIRRLRECMSEMGRDA
jgi:hypothetical protein